MVDVSQKCKLGFANVKKLSASHEAARDLGAYAFWATALNEQYGDRQGQCDINPVQVKGQMVLHCYSPPFPLMVGKWLVSI